MHPINFEHANVVYGLGQPEYRPLPAWQGKNSDGDVEVISCWGLTFWDIIRLMLGRRLWLRQITFGDPLQPQLPCITTPFEEDG